ncbi:siderophore ABC transporter substrate-binding protein [Cellulosilyticum sp. I15G10I2]|uniref:siderophore ABC transporter substrate-binding protein n=1 Tax=Cellulosilyticum sp. I15G10I2 TaxID=1892843 RepID=UPI00085C2AAD|nr:siderophore ABC transporter substrate-binding protein [Cellulosilyticum sp. I15G10I2]
MKKLFTTFLIAVLTLSFAGCAPQKTVQENIAVAEAGAAESVEAGSDAAIQEEPAEPKEITITHDLGETTLLTRPEKVVTFDYATLDSLRELEITMTGLPKSNIPTYLEEFEAEQYESVGTLFEPDYEKLVALKPDVIFISGRQIELYDELSKIAPTVFLPAPSDDYLGDVRSNLEILGEIFEKEEEVRVKISEIESSIKNIYEEASQLDKNALVLMINEGALSAYGPGSRFGMIHETFGFTPVDAGIEVSKHGQSISYEYIANKNPDYLFVIDRAVVAGGAVSTKEAFDNALMEGTKAYQNDRIIYLNTQIWYVASGGIKGTQIMLDEMKQALLN